MTEVIACNNKLRRLMTKGEGRVLQIIHEYKGSSVIPVVWLGVLE